MGRMSSRVARRHTAREIGDADFPLEIAPEQLVADHALVGRRVRVTPYAQEGLAAHRGAKGVIVVVVVVDGQIAGFQVQLESGPVFLAPKKDWFLGRQYVEDVYLDSVRAMEVRRALEHLDVQRDYYGPSWRGVEAMCEMLARVARSAAVEVAAWYRYESSTRDDQDGKDWRYVLPAQDGAVCVNCHSLLHDNVWTLATTIFNTRELDQHKLKLIHDDDHWTRTLLWARQTAVGLAIQGFTYEDAIADYERRLGANQFLWGLVGMELPRLRMAARSLGGAVPNVNLSIGFSHVLVGPWAVASHHPGGERGDSIITVTPDVMGDDSEYLRQIVRHELIHYALQTACTDASHGLEFHALADLVGLKPRHRD